MLPPSGGHEKQVKAAKSFHFPPNCSPEADDPPYDKSSEGQ